MTQAFRLASDPLRFVRLERARQHLLDQVSAQPALDFGGCTLLRELEREHGRPVLQRPAATGRIDGLLVDADGQHPKHVGAGPHRHHVQWTGGAPSVNPNLASPGLAERAWKMNARRHAIRGLARTSDPVAISRIKRRVTARERAHNLEDRADSSSLQGELGEALVDVV